MKVLICCSGQFGGTDFLLTRCYEWMVKHSAEADIVTPDNEILQRKRRYYDVVILPSSQMHNLIKLKHHGYHFQSILIWIMGCGSFNDTYYNPDRNKGLEKKVYKVFDYLAKRFATALFHCNSLCFTDEVGMDASLLQTGVDYQTDKNNYLIPIAIKIPQTEYDFQKNQYGALHICWIGRVSKDFKLIPIKHLMNDIERLVSTKKRNIDLIIVGTGDALDEVKQLAEKKNFSIQFKDKLNYDEIGEFLYDNADILVAMGTSALDGAKYGCPSVVITPVKPSNKEIVDYRWIFESKGYSLGEYPDIKSGPIQVKKSLDEICEEYVIMNDLNKQTLQYACQFDEDKIFKKLLDRPLPQKMKFNIWIHIYIFSFIFHTKRIVKYFSTKRKKSI